MKYLLRTKAGYWQRNASAHFNACWARRLGNGILLTKCLCLLTPVSEQMTLTSLANAFCNEGPGLHGVKSMHCTALSHFLKKLKFAFSDAERKHYTDAVFYNAEGKSSIILILAF